MAKRWNQCKCPTTDERINKRGPAPNGISLSHKKDGSTSATTWMNPENLLLSERRQTLEAMCCVTPCTQNAQNWQVQRQKADQWLPGWEGAGVGVTVLG